MTSSGLAAFGPNRASQRVEQVAAPFRGLQSVEALGDSAEGERRQHSRGPLAGEASMVTSAADPGPALWPLRPASRQNGSS